MYASAIMFLLTTVLLLSAYFVEHRNRIRREHLTLTVEAMRWSTFAGLVRRRLFNLGFRFINDEIPAATSGFDFAMEREGRRFLVVCRNGISVLPTIERLTDLQATVRATGSSGALLFLTSEIDRGEQAAARSMGIEIHSGVRLARQLVRLHQQTPDNSAAWAIESRATRPTVRSH